MKPRISSLIAFVLSAQFLPKTWAFPVASSQHPNTREHALFSTRRDSLRPSTIKFKNFEGMLDAFRDELVVVYFTKDTCGPCLLQRRELVSVRDRLPTLLTVDTIKWPEIGSRYKVGKLPCLLVVRNKAIVSRFEGLTRASDIMQKVSDFLESQNPNESHPPA